MADDKIAFDEVIHISDHELIARLKRLARADQTLNARLLVHLGEVEARGLHRDQAYSSMFAYCVEALGMFENQAYLRLYAARLARQFPHVLQLLAEGALSLSVIKQLGPHLTADNHRQLLERARGKHTRQVALLVAAIAPKPDVPNRMRKLPERGAAPAPHPNALFTSTLFAASQAASIEAPVTSPIDASEAPPADARTTLLALAEIRAPTSSLTLAIPGGVPAASVPACGRPAVSDRVPCLDGRTDARSRDANDALLDGACVPNRAPFALAAPRPRSSSKPLSPGRYKVEFTAEQALHDKLVQLQELLRHQVPDGDLAVIVERAADLLIESTLKQRFAQTRAPNKRPSAKPRNENSRYVPRAVVREVHQRDRGQCSFVSAEGKRCSERGFLELHHHDQTYARDGEATVENLRLVCRAHNALFSERDYGRAYMRSKRSQRREARDELVAKRVPSSIRCSKGALSDQR